MNILGADPGTPSNPVGRAGGFGGDDDQPVVLTVVNAVARFPTSPPAIKITVIVLGLVVASFTIVPCTMGLRPRGVHAECIAEENRKGLALPCPLRYAVSICPPDFSPPSL